MLKVLRFNRYDFSFKEKVNNEFIRSDPDFLRIDSGFFRGWIPDPEPCYKALATIMEFGCIVATLHRSISVNKPDLMCASLRSLSVSVSDLCQKIIFQHLLLGIPHT